MLLVLALAACEHDEPRSPPPRPVVPGAPLVGAAEGFLKLPVGTPLGGYTPRCTCLGNISGQDARTSAYNTAFNVSTGVQTYPSIKVVWVDNGDDHLVLTKTDTIYSFDGIVVELTRQLEEATGESLKGRVVHTTNHSHSSYGTFSDQKTFYLGSDKYNEENFQRFVAQIADVALEAWQSRQPARLGLGWGRDWDPDDRVYSDRRPENDALAVWPDAEPGMGKDPLVGMLRFDTLAGDPIAMVVNFGMHGTLGSERGSLVSSDSGGHLEATLEESFDEPVVVMFTQGSGGDASPRGSAGDYAAMETIGEYAREPLLALYERIPTSADPIAMQSASRAVIKRRDEIRVTRNGTVDWRYAPYREGFEPDDVIYDESDGSLLSPIDEFNTRYGAVFCGSGDLDLPVGGLTSDVAPYKFCLEVELLSRLILVFFELAEDELTLPLPESLRAYTTTSRLGPLPTLLPDGSSVVRDLLVGFFPGESTAMYTEQWRRRVEAELGFELPMMIGYAQDHEGYLLIPEDWLVGGYEPDISLWGPLEAEHVMEGVLDYARELLLDDVHQEADPDGDHGPTVYPAHALPTEAPDLTPEAGTRLEAPPPYYWVPLASGQADLVIPPEVPRVQGLVQLGWIGGDPGVDNPEVTIERQDGGQWVAVKTHAGRTLTEGHHDILVGYTPDPLFPDDDNDNDVIDPAEKVQTHYWWAGWQAVSHVRDRAGLPLGTYRLKVRGARYAGGNETWPWDSEPYELASEPFEVVPAAITLSEEDGGLWASLRAPSDGFRLIDLAGDHHGDNPITGPLTVELVDALGEVTTVTVDSGDPIGGRTRIEVDLEGAALVRVLDVYGNLGELPRG